MTTEPGIPDGTDLSRLDRSVQEELSSLPPDLAEKVGAHLVLAGELLEDDPETAYAHAAAARRRASRLAVVREAAAETAYAGGRYDTALSEYRTLRRMSGVADYLPVMADCQRALGKTDAALRLVREADEQHLSVPSTIELRIVEAGIRADLGQLAEATRLLQTVISQVEGTRAAKKKGAADHPANRSVPAGKTAAQQSQQRDATLRAARVRLHYALGDIFAAQQQTARARAEFDEAAELDAARMTDAAERVDELDGLIIDVAEPDDESGGGHPAAGDRPEPNGDHDN